MRIAQVAYMAGYTEAAALVRAFPGSPVPLWQRSLNQAPFPYGALALYTEAHQPHTYLDALAA
jgi:hypothetical protein